MSIDVNEFLRNFTITICNFDCWVSAVHELIVLYNSVYATVNVL